MLLSLAENQFLLFSSHKGLSIMMALCLVRFQERKCRITLSLSGESQ